jgi:hypothetical protein
LMNMLMKTLDTLLHETNISLLLQPQLEKTRGQVYFFDICFSKIFPLILDPQRVLG